MSLHFPVNHPLRPIYRGLAFLAGLYVLTFGVAGFFVTQGTPPFEAGAATALGLRTNLAFAWASIAMGALILLATALGRNIDRFVYMWAGCGFWLAGIAGMLVMGKQATNYLNFTMTTCVLSFVIGAVLATAGMYVKAQRT